MNADQYVQSLQSVSSALEGSALEKPLDKIKQATDFLQEGFNTTLGVHSILSSKKLMSYIKGKKESGQSSNTSETVVEQTPVEDVSPPLQETEDSISPMRVRDEYPFPEAFHAEHNSEVPTPDDPADLSLGYNDEFEEEHPRTLWAEMSDGATTTRQVADPEEDTTPSITTSDDVENTLATTSNEADDLADITTASTAGDEDPFGLVITAVLGLATLGTDIADAIEGAKQPPLIQAGSQIGV